MEECLDLIPSEVRILALAGVEPVLVSSNDVGGSPFRYHAIRSKVRRIRRQPREPLRNYVGMMIESWPTKELLWLRSSYRPLRAEVKLVGEETQYVAIFFTVSME